VRTMRFIGLLCCALVFGLTLSHVLQAPGSRALEGPTWLRVQQTFYGGFAVEGGLAEVTGLVTTSVCALLLRRRGHAPTAPLVAALCLLGTLLAYWFGNRPVNAEIAGWTASTLPGDWPAYRDQWETAHAVSAALSGVALLVLLFATVGRNGKLPPPDRPS